MFSPNSFPPTTQPSSLSPSLCILSAHQTHSQRYISQSRPTRDLHYKKLAYLCPLESRRGLGSPEKVGIGILIIKYYLYLDIKLWGNIIGCSIHLDNFDTFLSQLLTQFFENRSKLLAVSTPRGIKLNQDILLTLGDQLVEIFCNCSLYSGG